MEVNRLSDKDVDFVLAGLAKAVASDLIELEGFRATDLPTLTLCDHSGRVVYFLLVWIPYRLNWTEIVVT